ncbi:MAG: ABC transporter ATP-binding protein [Phycisphaerales bacterium]
MLTVDGVHKSFGDVKAVQGVSFELRPGEVVGLLGPNGAGKTTTIRMITGFLAPDSGRVLVHGHDTVDSPKIAKQVIGYLPESAPIYPEMRVTDYLKYRASIFGVERRIRAKAIAWVLERCWLKDVSRRRVGTLSKGYRQRVGLAAAILHDPPVLVLDEPTNGLDPTQIQETRSLIRDLTQDRTLLLCSHILPEVERLCGRVIIIAGGRVRADGQTATLALDSGPARYRVETRVGAAADAERTEGMLRGVEGVATVERLQVTEPVEGVAWVSWLVAAGTGTDLRERIAVAAQQRGVLVRELRREQMSLEAAFMRAVETEAGKGTAA